MIKRRYPFLCFFFSSLLFSLSHKSCLLQIFLNKTKKPAPPKKASLFVIFLLFSRQLNNQSMWQKQPNISSSSSSSSYRESIKTLEADIQHANSLAAALPKDYCGDCIQMRLSYSPFAPLFLYLIEWLDYTCTDTLPTYLGLLHILIYKVYVDGMPTMSSQDRKATLKEFYAIVYPSLRQLEGELIELEDNNKGSVCPEVFMSRKSAEDRSKLCDEEDLERENECSICMESCTKMVLPDCGHSLCICCFHDWNVRSQSCPFCRGNLKGVSSRDLWELTSNCDVVDTSTLAKENLRCFYLYIENLPLIIMPDTTHLFVYDYLI